MSDTLQVQYHVMLLKLLLAQEPFCRFADPALLAHRDAPYFKRLTEQLLGFFFITQPLARHSTKPYQLVRDLGVPIRTVPRLEALNELLPQFK